jgi:hypothetical protein
MRRPKAVGTSRADPLSVHMRSPASGNPPRWPRSDAVPAVVPLSLALGLAIRATSMQPPFISNHLGKSPCKGIQRHASRKGAASRGRGLRSRLSVPSSAARPFPTLRTAPVALIMPSASRSHAPSTSASPRPRARGASHRSGFAHRLQKFVAVNVVGCHLHWRPLNHWSFRIYLASHHA